MGEPLTTMEEWQKEIQPLLRRITWGSMCLRTDASMLRTRPAWETIAEDEMKIAQAELERALDRVRMARAIYRGKPEMVEAPIHLQAAE